ncbi:MAG: sulfurtransferase TusA family protein [Acidobacteriota bacterium]|jgi:tRNA 2-thiouridine synthesizing protein A
MTDIQFDDTLDTKGLNCPMPLVKARKQIGAVAVGQTLRVISTDRGSIKDFQGWAKIAQDIELVAQETVTEDQRELYLHFVKRIS